MGSTARRAASAMSRGTRPEGFGLSRKDHQPVPWQPFRLMHHDKLDRKAQMVPLGEWHVVVEIASGVSELEAAEISAAVTSALAKWVVDSQRGRLRGRARVRVDV